MASLDGRMVGVILAAGKGARMYPFSERSPKPILPILNRPLLAHQIEVMRDTGISDIHIVVGHLGYQVASAFGDGSQYGVRIRFIEQESTLGLAHAVGALESRVQKKRLETPDLDVSYEPPKDSGFMRYSYEKPA